MNLTAKQRSPKILQVSTSDIGGGAEKIAWDLHQGYVSRGYQSWLAVGCKYSETSTVFRIPNEAYWPLWLKLVKRLSDPEKRLPFRLRHFCAHLAKIHYRRSKKQGYEHFYFPGSRRLLSLPPSRPDILHCHNLHGGYFDLRVLPEISQKLPVIMTLHDAWLLAGHCAHSFDCDRWKIGCGQCPYLHVNVALQHDGSAYNWQRKREIYANSRVYIATPSQWLMNKVEQSMLAPAIVEHRVIPNGIDLSVFQPADKFTVRAQLKIPQEAVVLLFTAFRARQSVWKDYTTLRAAVELLANRPQKQPILFIALGEDAPPEQIGQATLLCVPYQTDLELVARYYQAADVYIHAAKADNFPTTILEALACGTPAIATAIGGIPEQIEDGKTGLLVPPAKPQEMAAAIQILLQDDALRRSMSRQAAETARRRFDLQRMTDDYLAWYQEL